MLMMQMLLVSKMPTIFSWLFQINVTPAFSTVASPPRKVNRVVSNGAAAILAAAPRGSVMKVHVKGKYAARDSYDIGDVVRISKALDAKTIKLAWLYPSNPNHDPATMNVPRSSIVRWRSDDAKAMRSELHC